MVVGSLLIIVSLVEPAVLISLWKLRKRFILLLLSGWCGVRREEDMDRLDGS
jgi:hypothetical protein